MKKYKKVLIFGPIAPPAGGISIHIARLKYLIQDDFLLDFIDESNIIKEEYFSINSFNPFVYLKKIFLADILFIQTGGSALRKFHILMGKLFFKKIIVTIHGYSKVKKMPNLLIDSLFFQLCNKIILVNPYIFKKLFLSRRKCVFQHAFIPPLMLDEVDLPFYISDWLEISKIKGNVILCANASRLNIFENQDLYGLDMCIEVTKRLVSNGYSVSCIYTVSSLENCDEMYLKYQRSIIELNLQENFLLLNGIFSFPKIIDNADIVLRPTNADGDAITIREALFLGKSIVASDIVQRPQGTLLFKTRDHDDFYLQLSSLLNGFQSSSILSSTDIDSINSEYRKCYSGIINSVLYS